MKTGWNKNLTSEGMFMARFDNYWDMKKPVFLQFKKVGYLILPEADI